MDPILECNQNNADHVFHNGKYVSAFATGIPFYTGDTISARLCSIDSQKSDTNTIIIATDLTASIIFSYYDCDYTFEANKNTLSGAAWTGPTLQYYAGYGQIQLEQLNTCRIDLPPVQSTYTVKVWFSWIDANGNLQADDVNNKFGYSYFGIGVYDPPYYNDQFVDCSPVIGTPTIYREGTLQLLKIELNNVTADPRLYDPANNNVAPVGAPITNLYLQKLNILIPAGRYDPTEIAQIITQQISNPDGVLPVPNGVNQIYVPSNPCLLNIQEPAGQDMVWVPVTNTPPTFDDTCYKYVAAGGTFPYIFVGADLMAIQYGVTGQVFQWSYGYTPFYNPATLNSKNVVCYVTGTPAGGSLRYTLLTTASGITIHDLQPASFWQSLGLYDLANQPMITPLLYTAGGTAYFTYNSWNVPEEGTSLNFFTPSYNRNPPVPQAGVPTYYETDAINNYSLLGNELVSNQSGGYYLIQGAINCGTTDYYDNTGIYNNIVAAVSTQYNTANTITGFGDSAIPFQNKGAPFIISSIAIDILDPLTKQTAAQLGNNNTIIFQINRAPQTILQPNASGALVPVPVLL